MPTEIEIKQQVRAFYDQVGWQEAGEGLYQNASYEDLRPVSRHYIHRCHMRVKRHLQPSGRYLLDGGSGPIQYPEYLEYSRDYTYRVCADISIQALKEARKRIGEHGLYVVADIANLPFAPDVFDGVVSLHTIHHLPQDEHLQAYKALYRVLKSQRQAVVVNGWGEAAFANRLSRAARFVNRVRAGLQRRLRDQQNDQVAKDTTTASTGPEKAAAPSGTFVRKNDAAWLKSSVGAEMPIEIFVWRSVGVNVLRTFVHSGWGGRWLLRLLFWMEERWPRWFGENGQYPLVVISKP